MKELANWGSRPPPNISRPICLRPFNLAPLEVLRAIGTVWNCWIESRDTNRIKRPEMNWLFLITLDTFFLSSRWYEDIRNSSIHWMHCNLFLTGCNCNGLSASQALGLRTSKSEFLAGTAKLSSKGFFHRESGKFQANLRWPPWVRLWCSET